MDAADLYPLRDAIVDAVLERRDAPRDRIIQRCLVWPKVGSGSVSWKGIAYDLSAAGIGVALPYPLAVGTVLVIEPVGLAGTTKLEAEVVRLTPVSYLWFCGCALSRRLSDAELQIWLAGAGGHPLAAGDR